MGDSTPKAFEIIGTAERCPHCGKPIQIGIVRIAGTEKRVRIMCKCLLTKARQQDAAIERRSAINRIYASSGLTTRQREMTFDGWEKRPGAEKAFQACANYAENFMTGLARRGTGLYLYGPTGSGKTRLVCAISNQLIPRGIRAVLYNVPTLLADLKAAYNGRRDAAEIIDRAHDAALLILDDLGTEHHTEWVRDTLYEIVNGRMEAGLPTIVTSNWEPTSKALASEDCLGARMMSRLNDHKIFVAVANMAADYRKKS